MGLIVTSGVHKVHWRRVPGPRDMHQIAKVFIEQGRHLYMEPDLAGEWRVGVDHEHALFLDNLIANPWSAA